eukprot:322561-Chlamydomonas_euryale.AAC.19
MVGVYGPRKSESKFGFSETGRLTCDVRLTCFASHGMGKQQQQSLERSMSESMQTALMASIQLDKIPKSCVDVFAMVLEVGGSDLAVAISAASVALADAGIELYDLVPACQVAKLGDSLLLDPTVTEESQQGGRALLAFMPACNEVTQLNLKGCWSDPDIREALELSMGACLQLRTAMREALLANISS